MEKKRNKRFNNSEIEQQQINQNIFVIVIRERSKETTSTFCRRD